MLAKILRLSTARYWTGNDAWKYKHIWHYRLRAKLINLFFDYHYFISDNCVIPGLKGEIRTLTTPLMYADTERIEHDKFTIAYYDAEGSFKNRYGLDVVKKLRFYFPQVRWLPIHSGEFTQEQMKEIYKRIDLYIRPSRWDGDPFMVREALHFGVDTISSFSSDKRNIKIDPDNVVEWKNVIDALYKKWLKK